MYLVNTMNIFFVILTYLNNFVLLKQMSNNNDNESLTYSKEGIKKIIFCNYIMHENMILLMLLLISYIFECHYVTFDPSLGVRLYFHLEKFGIHIKMLQDKSSKIKSLH